jgi:hypothetical protein
MIRATDSRQGHGALLSDVPCAGRPHGPCAAPHTTPEDRTALGKEARRVSRSDHAVYKPSPDRPDPLTILEAQSAARVPELVPTVTAG